MKKIKINISHFFILIGALFFWFYVMTGFFNSLGIENSQRAEDLSAVTNTIVFCSMVATFLLTLLGPNLLSYIIIARLIKIPRSDLEQSIRGRAKVDPHENIKIAQKFYRWCLDLAYKIKLNQHRPQKW